MDLSIVIVSYNVKDFLLDCLKSVYADDSFVAEVIVVDNASSDGSSEAVRKYYPDVILIENSRNKGFPAANNQAFKIAKGKYILMLNPDAILLEKTLVNLIRYLDKNHDAGIIAPQLLNTDGSIQQSVWRFPSLKSIFAEMFYLNFLLGKKNYSDQNKDSEFEAESFSGAAILFRRSVLDSIGMLDEKLFWIEDVDFCYRAKKAGMRLMYFPAAKAIHHISKSAKTNYNVSISNQIFNKIKFYKKHKSKPAVIFLILLSLYHVLAKIALFLILSPFSKTYWLKAKAYLYTLPRTINPPDHI